MSSTPREIGTLVVVVIKANHLPNKRHIGKQDPYCAVTVNEETRRTKAIKRGGQHPEWDEEIRFTLYEDDEALLNSSRSKSKSPPRPPPKDTVGPRKIKGGKIMKLACYADDIREPDLIGEADVDLTEVLTKGETDEWFNLTAKDKFAGKVYLELTFWSNEPPPEKKVAVKVPKTNKQYGGPGSFVPLGERPPGQHLARHTSANAAYPGHGPLDLYVAPYEQQTGNSVDKVTQEFGELGINTGHRRRESGAPVASGFAPYPQGNYNNYSVQSTNSAPGYPYDREPSPLGHIHPPNSQYNYHPPYDQNPARRSTSGLPVTPSGFVPLPQPSGFMPLQAPPPEPFPQATPGPMQYNPAPSQFVVSNPYPQPVASPVSYIHHSGTPYQQPMPPQSQLYPTYQYAPSDSNPPPQQPHYAPMEYPPAAQQPPMNSMQPQLYNSYTPAPQEVSLALPNPPTTTVGSRPLPPQPQMVYAQPQPPAPLPNPPLPPAAPAVPLGQNGAYSPPQHQGTISPARSSSYPMPLPPTPGHTSGSPLPPPPPPPASVVMEIRKRRLSALPQPPVVYQQPFQQPEGNAPDSYGYNHHPVNAYPPPLPNLPAQEWTVYH